MERANHESLPTSSLAISLRCSTLLAAWSLLRPEAPRLLLQRHPLCCDGTRRPQAASRERALLDVVRDKAVGDAIGVLLSTCEWEVRS